MPKLFSQLVQAINEFTPDEPIILESQMEKSLREHLQKRGFLTERQVTKKAEDRLHRIGQKNQVFAHYLEGIGTFDEILSEILLRKNVEISNVLGDKLERLNNQQALQYLESKFKFAKKSRLVEMLQEYKNDPHKV